MKNDLSRNGFALDEQCNEVDVQRILRENSSTAGCYSHLNNNLEYFERKVSYLLCRSRKTDTHSCFFSTVQTLI